MTKERIDELYRQGYMTEDERNTLLALLDLWYSVENTGDSSDDGESYTVMGNVDTPTLRTLGFDNFTEDKKCTTTT